MTLSHRLNLYICDGGLGEKDVEPDCIIFHNFLLMAQIVSVLEQTEQKWEDLALEGGRTQKDHSSPTAWQPAELDQQAWT